MINRQFSNYRMMMFPSYRVLVWEDDSSHTEQPVSNVNTETETETETETQQTTLLEQEKLNNVLFVGLFVFLGIIAGLIAGKILWDRLHQ